MPSVEKISSNQIQLYSSESINILTNHLTNTYLNKILLSLLPEHRLHLLTLVSFYIKLQQKTEFTDLELEFLMKGTNNNAANINVTLSDFGIIKTQCPSWISKDTLADLQAMSLLQGDLDHFICAIFDNEPDWKRWYLNPFTEELPKVEIDLEKSTTKSEWIDLNSFRALIVHKVLRPDTYTTALSLYVNKTLHLELQQPSWEFIFANPTYKTIIINCGTRDSIHQCLVYNVHGTFHQANKLIGGNQPTVDLDCTLATISEIQTALKQVSTGFVLLRNVHVATPEMVTIIQHTCEENDQSQDLKYRLIITKDFTFRLPTSILSSSCLQIAYDVIEAITSKSTLNTSDIKDENIIYKNVSTCLSLLKTHQTIVNILANLPPNSTQLVYFTCLTLGLLQSRQCLAASGLRNSQPWNLSCLIHCLNEIHNFNHKITSFSDHLTKTVFANYLQDPLDQDYVRQLLDTLTANNHQILVNSVKIKVPGQSLPPGDLLEWFCKEACETGQVSIQILQLHEKDLMYANLIRSENFMETLQQLWDTNDTSNPKLDTEISQDWLHFALQMCRDRLPPLLPAITQPFAQQFAPNTSISFALYQVNFIVNHIS